MDPQVKNMIQGEHSPREVFKFGLVIAGILLLSSWLALRGGNTNLTEWIRYFMGVFFLIFATFKLIGFKMFTIAFAGYDVIAKRVKIYSSVYPFIELGLGILYLADVWPVGRDLLTLLIMAVSSIGVLQELKRRRGIHCACLGNIIKLPLSTVSLVEDVGMGLMALFMLVRR